MMELRLAVEPTNFHAVDEVFHVDERLPETTNHPSTSSRPRRCRHYGICIIHRAIHHHG
ncbi:MAG: hypothetical protein R3B96_21245 [Pirellulaceae bacterium]